MNERITGLRILIIDDDEKMYSESLIWRLKYEGYTVVYCRSVQEVKCGWVEVTEETLRLSMSDNFPDCVLEKLEPLLGERYENNELFENKIKTLLNQDEFNKYGKDVLRYATQDALKPLPDCILLDMMMPRGDIYTKRETNDGKETGIALLKDKEIWVKIKDVPVIVVTVNQELSLRGMLQKDFAPMVKDIILKPVETTEIIQKINKLFSGVQQ